MLRDDFFIESVLSHSANKRKQKCRRLCSLMVKGMQKQEAVIIATTSDTPLPHPPSPPALQSSVNYLFVLCWPHHLSSWTGFWNYLNSSLTRLIRKKLAQLGNNWSFFFLSQVITKVQIYMDAHCEVSILPLLHFECQDFVQDFALLPWGL